MWKEYRYGRLRCKSAVAGNIFGTGPSIDSMKRRTFLQLAAAAPALAQSHRAPSGIAWTQWGGLVGSRLYLRDRRSMMAVDLG
jgi:hypothetical protein